MTKQEMAEWLAEHLLGMKKSGEWIKTNGKCPGWWNGNPKFECIGNELIDVIYSPDGFFAVWDVVEKKITDETMFTIIQENEIRCLLNTQYQHDIQMGISGRGKDRYEAFYNAVYEAMKG